MSASNCSVARHIQVMQVLLTTHCTAPEPVSFPTQTAEAEQRRMSYGIARTQNRADVRRPR